MNIIFINWKCFGAEDLLLTLDGMGHNINIVDLSDAAEIRIDDEFVEKLCKRIESHNAGLVISFNYFPSVSEACQRKDCRYFAWIYDSPFLKLYDKTVTNSVNFIGTFDYFTVNEFESRGIDTVHYLPLAANVNRMRKCALEHERITDADVAFVGSLYNDKNNFYERLLAAAKDMELAGYMDAVIEAQLLVYGYNFVEKCLTKQIMDKIRNSMPYDMRDREYITEERIYSDYYFSPRITFLERSRLLGAMAGFFKTEYFTFNREYRIRGAANRGPVDYYIDMPAVFANAKINLNISLKSIRTGVPLRVMDILGTGGFLLTNYQEDMFRHFEPDKHFVYYSSMEEAVDKADYYLRHEDERTAIAENALECMQNEHTYEVVVPRILDTVMK